MFSLEDFPECASSPALTDKVHKYENKHELVLHIQSILQNDVFPNLAVVNSEIFPWLVYGASKRQPDLFICPIPFYKSKLPNNQENYPSSVHRFGVIDDLQLYHSVVLINVRLEITDHAFGELAMHLEHLSAACNGDAVRGMLIGECSFMLYEHRRQTPLRRIVGHHNDIGSMGLIKQFFAPVLSQYAALHELCGSLGVSVADPFKLQGLETGLLGQGSFGTVVKVVPVNDPSKILAMKCSTKDNAFRLGMEYERLSSHAKECHCNLVARPVTLAGGTTTESEECGSQSVRTFLMEPVGEYSCSKELIRRGIVTIASIMNALFLLHTHEPTIVHGDPLFMETPFPSVSSDMLFLIRSIVGHARVDRDIHALIANYAQKIDRASLCALIGAVERRFV